MRNVGLFSLLLCTACSIDAGDSNPAVSVRDSAGVRIVEHRSLDSSTAFLVGDPVFRIGDDISEYEFARVSAGAIGPDGSVVVADYLTDELLVIERDGVVAWKAGGTGEGPGEFGNLSGVGWQGDTVVAHDWGQGRVTYVVEGTVLSSELLPDAVRRGSMRTLAPGQIVVTPSVYRPITDEPWVRMPVIRHELGTEVVDTVLIFDRAPGIPSMTVIPNPLRGFGTLDANASRIVVGRGDRSELSIYRLDGKPEQIWRWPHPSIPLTDAVWNAYRNRTMESPGDRSEAEMGEYLRGLRGSAQGPLPAFRTVSVDHLGRGWVGEYDVGSLLPREFQVFGSLGEWLGLVTLPPRVEILDVGAEHILAIQRDQFDVESIVLLPLLPPPRD